MAYEWLESTDFPSGTGGLGVDDYAPWVHPETKAVYLWDSKKNSWMLFASSGTRLYSMTIDPALDGVTLYDGDLWWDSRALELRVYHRPTPQTPGQTVTGRWVSSTNPEMSLTDLDRNLIIGIVEMDAPTTDVYEGIEVMFSVDRPYGGAPDDKVVYEWRVSPNPLSYGGNEYNVIISNPNEKTTSMIWEVGTHVMDGDVQVGFNVYCRVTAAEEYEDAFVNTSARSESVIIYPKKAPAATLDYVTIRDTNSELEVIAGSTPVDGSNGEYEIEAPFTGSSFFVVPEDDVMATYDGLTFTLGDGTNVGSQYMESLGPIQDLDEKPYGYIIDLDNVDLGTPTEIFIVGDNDSRFNAKLTVKSK